MRELENSGAGRACFVPLTAKRHLLRFLGDQGESQFMPAAFGSQVADKVLFMQSLHYHDDRTADRIVKTRAQALIKCPVAALAAALGEGRLGTKRVIHDDEVGAHAGEPCAEGACNHLSAGARLNDIRPVDAQAFADAGESAPVPGMRDQRADFAQQLDLWRGDAEVRARRNRDRTLSASPLAGAAAARAAAGAAAGDSEA